ncbi:unnamed protein product, partial [marine sediment metagenome]
MERPTKPCYVCGSNTWWLTPDGRWLCGKCHPNPNPDANPGEEGPGEPASEPASELASALPSPALEVLALRDRVIKGNDKLFAAWQQIRELDGEEKEYQWDRWNEGQERLHSLCLELQAKGYHDCLYIENGKRIKSCLSETGGWWCQVCP